MLARVCEAFAYSPLALMADVRAVLRCIDLAVRKALQTGAAVWPSSVEEQLTHVCAGCGCGINTTCLVPAYGPSLLYCDGDCSVKVRFT